MGGGVHVRVCLGLHTRVVCTSVGVFACTHVCGVCARKGVRRASLGGWPLGRACWRRGGRQEVSAQRTFWMERGRVGRSCLES